MQDRVVSFGARVWYSGPANSMVSVTFTSDGPLLLWQRNLWKKIGY